MRVSFDVIACIAILLLGWLIADLTWRYNTSLQQRPEIAQTTFPISSGAQTQHSVPLSSCTDCYSFLRTRNRKRYETHDIVSVENLHDAILVISALVIATSWVTLFSFILHSRVQRDMENRFNALFPFPFDPIDTFLRSRRHG